MHRRGLWVFLLVATAGIAVATLTRGVGFTARAKAWPLEETVMLRARRWAIPQAVANRVNPVAPSEDALRAGREHWADHCATCHGNDGSGETALGRSLYPPAPDMRLQRTQAMTDGALFYLIERGIPFTGMPAWGTGTADGQTASWKLVQFIRHLPTLSAEEEREMEALNPKSAADVAHKRDIDEFLSSGK